MTHERACTACRHAAHWRECRAIVRGLFGSDTQCACQRRGPQPDATCYFCEASGTYHSDCPSR
jgi:hypothetical protein